MKRRNGEYVGAYTPYGYRKAEDDKNHLIVDEYAAEVVQSIFSMYKDGLSICRIADRLNDMGVLSPMEYKLSQGIHYDTLFKQMEKAQWSYNAVKRVLTNEIYIGVMVQGKTGTPNYKVRTLQQKDESEWIKVEDAVEPIIKHHDFMAVKMMLGRDMRCTASEDDENLLSGFIYCADCGSTMIRKTVPSKTKKYTYYVCAGAKQKNGCTSHSISVKEVEKTVLHAIHDHVELVLSVDAALERASQLPSAERALFNYEAQITKLEEEIERFQGLKLRLYEDLADGVINKAEYMEFRNRYTNIIEERKAALERVKREQKEAGITGITERHWVQLFRENEGVEELNRRILMETVDRILIHEDHRIEIIFKYREEFEAACKVADKCTEVLDIAV